MSAWTQTEPPAGSKYERRKALIVRAAAAVINCKGVRGMTFADVAGRLGLAPTAVNYYFRRKEDLAAACFLDAIGHFNALLDRSARTLAAPDRLREFLDDFACHAAAADAGSAAPVAAFNDVRTVGDPAVNAAYVDMFRRFRAALTDRLPRIDRNARTHLLISQVFWAVLWLRRYDPADYRRMTSRLADILAHGLAGAGIAWMPRDLPRTEDPVAAGGHQAFLRAATELINEHGYLGASVSRISARLNVTKGSFYHHIPAKDDLVGQCFDRTLEIMRSAQAAADACTASGFDNLAALASSMIRRDVSGEAPLLRTSALTAVPEALQAHLVRRFDQIAARLASVVSDGIADGSVRPVDANVTAQAVTALINASAELHHWAPGLDTADAAGVYARPLFMGLFGAGQARVSR